MTNIYESERLLNEYLLFHYGSPAEILPWDFGPVDALGFAERSVNVLLDRALLPSSASALDLGCAVGRSCYELAQSCERVIGIDFSQSFVNAAEQIRTAGEMPCQQHIEGRAIRDLVAKRPENTDASRISFEQGDAMKLRSDLGSFEVVHAANLLCRLPEPQRLIQQLPSLVKSGGQLLLTTPCTWLEEFTPAQNWPQGSTFEWLKESLSPAFELAGHVDLPFLIREHARKYQWSVALGTRWIRV